MPFQKTSSAGLLVLTCLVILPVTELSDSLSSVFVNPSQPGSASLVGIDASATHTMRFPRWIRDTVMAGAETTYEREEGSVVVPLRGEHDSLMTMGQRSKWIENYNNARDGGMDVAQAQELALRGAADGRLYAQKVVRDPEDEVEFTGASTVDRRGSKTVTCMACHYVMRDRSEIKPHYSSDWHVFNSIRKAVTLRPVSFPHFMLRVQDAEAQEEGLNTRSSPVSALFTNPEGASVSAGADMMMKQANMLGARRSAATASTGQGVGGGGRRRDESKGSLNAAVSHRVVRAPGGLHPREAKKKRAAEKRKVVIPCEAVPVEVISDLVDIMPTRCPFDGVVHKSVADNVDYMERIYNCWFPKGDKMKDLEGLICFLLRKVHLGFACITCGDTFNSAAGAQGHMQDKWHCRLPDDEQLLREEISSYCRIGPLLSLSGEETLATEDVLALDMTSLSIGQDFEASTQGLFRERVQMFREAASRKTEQEEASYSPVVGPGGKVRPGTRVDEGHMSASVRKKRSSILRRGGTRLQEKREQRKEDHAILSEELKNQRELGVARTGWRESEFARRTVLQRQDPERTSKDGLLPKMSVRNGPGFSNSTALCTMRNTAGAVANVRQWNKLQKKEIMVYTKNYYTRKATMGKSNMLILNSGYRP